MNIVHSEKTKHYIRHLSSWYQGNTKAICAICNMDISVSDVGKGDLAKHVKDHKEKCMLIWQIKLLSNSKIPNTFFS